MHEAQTADAVIGCYEVRSRQPTQNNYARTSVWDRPFKNDFAKYMMSKKGKG